MVEKLTKLLIKCGVTWFPKRLAEKLHANDVVIVTRCSKCDYCKKLNAPQGIVHYCRVHERVTSANGYCHNSAKE